MIFSWQEELTKELVKSDQTKQKAGAKARLALLRSYLPITHWEFVLALSCWVVYATHLVFEWYYFCFFANIEVCRCKARKRTNRRKNSHRFTNWLWCCQIQVFGWQIYRSSNKMLQHETGGMAKLRFCHNNMLELHTSRVILSVNREE